MIRSRVWKRFGSEEELTKQPYHSLLSVIHIPGHRPIGPWWLIGQRLLYAVGLLLAVAVVVYVGRDGYSQELTFLDALYYSTVTLSTTGYGDIVPVSQSARLVNVFVITPLRIAFVVLLVGTTLSVLTERSRRTWQIQRWRNKVHNHTIIAGYGSKGRSAVRALLADDVDPAQIVVIDLDQHALLRAENQGFVTVHGSATKSDVLRIAGIERARAVVVAPTQDETAVLITLSARELAPEAVIVASVRESENQHLLEQSGADSVVISSETAGRMLGMATVTPPVVQVMEDLLSPDDGFAISDREVRDDEVGKRPRQLEDVVLGVIRSGELHRFDAPELQGLRSGDRLLFVRHETGHKPEEEEA